VTAYYNENDPKAAAWLRELIKQGHIAPGDVDERSIKEVQPEDVRNYTQCHFFAGIGVWSYALRLAGWPDGRPVWTGSCPCQSFSAAGKQEGFADPRHLWPEWFRLIQECRPVAVFGEQVAAAIRHGWLDLIQADLEGLDYAVGSIVMGAHSVGAPHIRQRLFFVGSLDNTAGSRYAPAGIGQSEQSGRRGSMSSVGCEVNSTVEHAESEQMGISRRAREPRSAPISLADTELLERGQVGSNSSGRGAGSGTEGLEQRSLHGSAVNVGNADEQGSQRRNLSGSDNNGNGSSELATWSPSPTNGFWRDAEWLPCIDGKARPVEPGTFPLAYRAPARVGRLRGYGNAIVAPLAQAFIEAYLEATEPAA
jgi:DNA (cytosine-5)-methyltransferase 1